MSEVEPGQVTLTVAQRDRLLAARAAWEEGEDEERLERLRQREDDLEALRLIARLLEASDFASGGALTSAQTARLLSLARALAPNPNLNARLLCQPDEPETFQQDLRALVYGAASLPVRLRAFLQRRQAGMQTATQLLCAVFPEEYPLVTRTGLRALEVTSEQWREAQAAASRRFGLASDENPPAVLRRVLTSLLLYEAARTVLDAADYLEVHRLLTYSLAGSLPWQRRRATVLYTPLDAEPDRAGIVIREASAPVFGTGDSSGPTVRNLAGIAGRKRNVAIETLAISQSEALSALERAFATEGLILPPRLLRSYYLSLQTKPFALLAGLPGTGKTRLAALFAAALTGNPTQFRLLPVRPDWTTSAPLLGPSRPSSDIGSTPFLEFLARAAHPANAARAFFLCLDELNLARVEHYLAELLSAMEMPNREILLPDGRVLPLPDNLFLTGTLNHDPASYPLSRKVLDRANLLVLSDIRLQAGASEDRDATDFPLPRGLLPEACQAAFLSGRVGGQAAARERLRQVSASEPAFAERVVEALAQVNALLEPFGLQFAYRVRDETLRYCANSFDRDGTGLLVPANPEANLDTALDFQLLQRVLPRLTGAREQLEAPARALLRWAEQHRLAMTATRLARMLSRLQRDGFVSLVE